MLMATMMMLPIGKTVTTTRMMWPQAVKVSASRCLRAQLNQALHCIVLKQILDKRVRELVYYDFFQHKSFCSKRLCRVQLLYNHIGNKASALQCGLSSIYMLFRNLVLMTESAI